ncbi:MAG: hypothetical protein M1822_004408 [Bathelium mastoideum]|nr:MAG: hypothetical protein M1822_004408 [Bathelium mastoideum]
MTQIILGLPTFAGVLLVVFWALSPVGSQASLRIMNTANVPSYHNTTIQYQNSYFNYSYYGNGDDQTEVATGNALFTTSLLGPKATKESNLDTWGKLKVPMIEALDVAADGDGWKPVSANTTYSSLTGLLTTGSSASTNTSMNIETSYWSVVCSAVKPTASPTVLAGNQTVASGTGAAIFSPDTKRILSENIRPRTILYGMWLLLPNYTYPSAECTIQTSYVELDVFCFGQNCTTLRMRPSTLPHNPTGWTSLDEDNGTVWEYWPGNFVASMAGHPAAATMKEVYFVNPDNPANESSCGGYLEGPTNCDPLTLERLYDPRTFSISLTQLMNTHWLSYAGPEITTNNLQSSPLCYDSADLGPLDDEFQICQYVHNTTATVQNTTQVIICNEGWFAVLILASLVMLTSTIWRATTSFLRKAPDILFNVSTLTQDNPYAAVPSGGSAMDGAERTRLLQGLTVRLGDVEPGKDVGHVGLGVISGQEAVGPFIPGRLYD